MSDKYILTDEGEPVLELDLMTWAQWIEVSQARRVGLTRIGDCEVSTVFLGLDHRFGAGPPILWETMVFGGPMDQDGERCSGNRSHAQAMHARWVEKVKAAQPSILKRFWNWITSLFR